MNQSAIIIRAACEAARRRGCPVITGIPTPVQYVVMDASPSARAPYVAARPGWYRRESDGKQVRDMSCDPRRSGPEMTENSKHALRFPSHRSAARVASTLATPRIVTI